MSRIIVTGGSGFIGSNLVQHCHEAGHELLNIDIRPPRNAASAGRFLRANILQRDVLIKAVREFDPHYILHLAARTDLDGTTDCDYGANIAGVSNMIAAAKSAHSLRRAIFASSMYVCKLGHIPCRDDEYCPHTAYGHSKELGEYIVRREASGSFCWAIVRPTSIWGPWFDIPYKTFFNMVRRGLYVHPKGSQIKRSYGFVLNTVSQLTRLMEFAEADRVHGRVFYLADYEPVDTLYWAQTIASQFGLRGIRQVPISTMRAFARLGDLLKSLGMGNIPICTFRLNNLLTNAVFDLSPIEQISGELPFTLEQGVRITVDWMCQQGASRYSGVFGKTGSLDNL